MTYLLDPWEGYAGVALRALEDGSYGSRPSVSPTVEIQPKVVERRISWEAGAYSAEVREVLDMFGENGNIEDYWLGTPSLDNTRLLGQTGWRAAEELIRDVRAWELGQWILGGITDEKRQVTITRIGLESLMAEQPNAPERGGGITGLDQRVHAVNAGLLASGKSLRASTAHAG